MLDVSTQHEADLRANLAASKGEANVLLRWRRSIGLTARMVLITISAVLFTMIAVYITRIESNRETWIHAKIVSARGVIAAFELDGRSALSDRAKTVLLALGVESVTFDSQGERRTIVATPSPPPFVEDVSHDDSPLSLSVPQLLRSLFPRPGAAIRVTNGDLELTLDEAPLTEMLWRVSRTLLGISVIVSVVITFVVWATLWRMVLRPVRRLTSAIIAFGEDPQDLSRVIIPSGRSDEIGRAETALAGLQESLVHELAHRKRLAELGMAVARVNHDLRNMLTAAQLISDRLAAIPDPLAQRLAPRLVATLDRAIQFCQATLTYGAGREQPPNRRGFDLNTLVRQIIDTARAESDEAIDYQLDIPPSFEVYADPDHILRALENLSRNAAQVLSAKGAGGGRPKAVRFAAIRTEGVVLIEISDTGPGFPPDEGERMFEPFHKSTNEFGAGLGLAIAADLVARNGGAITLAPARADDFYCGARFLIKLPTHERPARRPLRQLPVA